MQHKNCLGFFYVIIQWIDTDNYGHEFQCCITFVNTWNDYFMQLIMLKSSDAITVSLGIARLQSEFATNYGLMMAGATLGAVPIVAVFICFQKYFTQGITMGAVKG